MALEPDHLSAYALTLDDPDGEGLTRNDGDHLPVSPGARAWRARVRSGQDEERAAAQYEHAVDRMAAAGFRGYEISNFARPGHECRHNLAYWNRRPHEAVGPGAHAFDGRTRRWNAARLDAYVAALVPEPPALPSQPPGGAETLDPRASEIEALILALRLDTGVPRDAAEAGRMAPHLGWARDAGLMTASPDGSRLSLTTRGRLLSNELFARLL
jgi:oxygen-independent coproporphyrinogen-3 oxidase